jgi:hypothetical protein
MIRRLWPLLPLLVLAAVVALFSSTGGSLVDLVGSKPPPKDEFQIRRVQLSKGEVRIRVTNPQREQLTIGSVAIDARSSPSTSTDRGRWVAYARARSSPATTGSRTSP